MRLAEDQNLHNIPTRRAWILCLIWKAQPWGFAAMKHGSVYLGGLSRGDTPPKDIPTLGAAGGRPKISEMTQTLGIFIGEELHSLQLSHGWTTNLHFLHVDMFDWYILMGSMDKAWRIETRGRRWTKVVHTPEMKTPDVLWDMKVWPLILEKMRQSCVGEMERTWK